MVYCSRSQLCKVIQMSDSGMPANFHTAEKSETDLLIFFNYNYNIIKTK